MKPEAGWRVSDACLVIPRGILILSIAVLCFTLNAAMAQQAAPSAEKGNRPNELLAGKLIFVEEMPDNIDAWIADDLRRWGKYKVTTNKEGADLVIEAVEGEKSFPSPRLGTPGTVPLPRRNRKNLPVASISVIDWVTNSPLFTADFVKKHGGKQSDPASSHVTIRAEGYNAQQIATGFISQLQDHVKTLEARESGGNSNPPSGKN